MPKKLQLGTTKALHKELHGNSAHERLLHRLHSVVLVLNGFSAIQVARIYADSPRAVAYWVGRFKRHGIEGLQEEKRPGRPSKLSDSQLKKLQSFLARSTSQPRRINADVVSAFILKKFHISLTPRQCWRILNRLRA